VFVNNNNGSFILIKVMSHDKDAKFSICFLVHGVYFANDPWTRWMVRPQVQSVRMHGSMSVYSPIKKRIKISFVYVTFNSLLSVVIYQGNNPFSVKFTKLTSQYLICAETSR
jgi:hypothetical protein